MRILVGTWGTGPFDSDAAEDYVDALERMSASERLGALEEIFGRAAMAADDSWREPGELVAAAAVVAANMPLGTSLPLNEDYEEIPQWLVKPVPDELAASAIRALDAALPAGGWFWRSWTDEGDRIESETMVANLKAVLVERA
jgi:alpha-glucosidase